MRLFIKIENGQPVGHPYFESNLLEAGIDASEGYTRFYRVAPPEPVGTYEVAECSYEWVNGVVSDVWTIRDMDDAEAAQKRSELIELINSSVADAKAMAQTEIEKAESEEDKVIWADFLSKLEEYECVDPDSPKLPAMPRRLDDGTLVSGVTAGTAPDVIS